MRAADLREDQRPRFWWAPDADSTTGDEAVELARMAGLVLDPWQEFVTRHSLGERPDGKWAAFEVGLMVSRQQGKGAVLEARALAGLFLLDERFIVWSAHMFDTSLEAFRRLLMLIENTPDLDRRVKRVSRSHGEEGIELKGGQRIRFRTRSKGGGRGFTGDLLILDEAMEITEKAHGALLPTLSARPNPQVIYAGSAVDQWVHEHGKVFARIRERGIAGGDQGLAYFEWSAGADRPDEVTPEMATDETEWKAANPALGIRISSEHVGREQRSMDPRTFAVERLGVGDWPRGDGESESVISAEGWQAMVDEDSSARDPVVFAFDVTPDRGSGSIGAAGRRDDGLSHIEVVEQNSGTNWIVDRLVELHGKHHPEEIICDGGGPAASLLGPLAKRGIEVRTVTAREYAQACGIFYDTCDEGALRHLGTTNLNMAVAGASQRTLGDAWAWSRKSSTTDISPLVACTLALWGLAQGEGESVYEDRGVLSFG